jgi:hypothetical protein
MHFERAESMIDVGVADPEVETDPTPSVNLNDNLGSRINRTSTY